MSDGERRRWRFSLKSLILAIALCSVVLALILSGGRVREMGGTGIYARHYGWPVAYLRVPVREHAGVAADLFVPGLIVDLTVAAVVVAGTVGGLSLVARRRRLSSPSRAKDLAEWPDSSLRW